MIQLSNISEHELKVMIPSPDVRNYAAVTHWEFTDLQRAALLNHSTEPYPVKLPLLEKLGQETDNEELRNQIDRCLRNADNDMSAFIQNSDNSSIYLLRTQEYDDWSTEINPEGYFLDWATAHKVGVSRGFPFQIYKNSIRKDAEPTAHQTAEDICYYNRHGQALDLICNGDEEPFQQAFYEIPMPFKHGDVVRIIGDRDDDCGVIELCETWQEYIARCKRFGCDYSDVQVRVSLPRDDGLFSHVHINPVQLAYYTDDGSKKYELLNILSKVYSGSATVERLLCASAEFWNHSPHELGIKI